MKQFKTAASANMWTADEKAMSLVIALRGDALNNLQEISEHRQKDDKYLVTRLEMRYGISHLQQVYHAQLKNRYQNPERRFKNLKPILLVSFGWCIQ